MKRLRAMIIKEIWALLRDRKSRIVLVLPPLIQLLIFTFATTMEVKNVDIAVLDRSNGVHAAELVQRIAGSPQFREVIRLESDAALKQAIDNQQVMGALVIESDFDARVAAGKSATIGLVLDGRKSNGAQILGGYVSRIAGEYGAELRPEMTARAGGSAVTNWYNPSLDYMWFTLPSLVAVIVSVAGISITSQSVARERELGTFDQLMVSPLRVHEILIGMAIPPMLVGLFNGTLFLFVAQFAFGVPFTGSYLLFFISLIIFMLSLTGIGLMVSAASMTQQQAFLGSFIALVPLMLLSGYASPIDNMPEWLQIITYADPIRYFLIIVEGLFLKAMPAHVVFQQVWPLALIACVTLGAAAWLFRARME
jgi:ABC-2 type transport system permease protein